MMITNIIKIKIVLVFYSLYLFVSNRFRIKDDNQEEDMTAACVGHDVELAEKVRKPPEHCSVHHGSNENESTATLKIRRTRKEGIESLKTISDFRKYICKATKEGNQDGQASVQLLGMYPGSFEQTFFFSQLYHEFGTNLRCSI